MSDSIFDFSEMARLEVFWWVGGGDGPKGLIEGDWMACIYKPMGKPDEVVLKYRFRYYRDDRAFKSEDKKSSYVATVGRERLDEAIKATDELAEKMLSQFGGQIYRKRFVDGNRAKAMRWLMSQPFAHVQRMTMDEYNRRRPQ